MNHFLTTAAMPMLRRMDPERAHRLALVALRLGLTGRDRGGDDPALQVSTLGLSFPNPLGLAAGFDKDAVAVAGLMRLGFGFVETGTVTPRPQPGNPRPRLFRLEQDRAVINRMGFNNGGVEAYRTRLAALGARPVPLGANIGINKEGADPERDYPALVAAVAPHADYVVINVSSPNTPGLRDLQGEARLAAILQAITAHPSGRTRPLLVKVAPDLSDAGLGAVVRTAIEGGAQGLIVSNTTISRPAGLASVAAEAGGLSGAPLRQLATDRLRRAARLAQGRLILIGCGGVASGADALEKIRAGAHLVQLYTAFAYQGPAIITRIKAELAGLLRQQGFARVTDAIGADI